MRTSGTKMFAIGRISLEFCFQQISAVVQNGPFCSKCVGRGQNIKSLKRILMGSRGIAKTQSRIISKRCLKLSTLSVLKTTHYLFGEKIPSESQIFAAAMHFPGGLRPSLEFKVVAEKLTSTLPVNPDHQATSNRRARWLQSLTKLTKRQARVTRFLHRTSLPTLLSGAPS